MKRITIRLAWLGLLCLLSSLFLTLATVEAAPNFSSAGFLLTWNRVDKVVDELPNPGRGYTWGPLVAGSGMVTTETYNGVSRKVQYFDKARMEINQPDANPSDLFYVTTGLLVKEMVTGQRQDGDNIFTRLTPSPVQIAGDPNLGGANAIAPTYASFQGVTTSVGNINGQPRAANSAIINRLDKVGQVTTFSPPEQRLLTDYDSATQHNIADVFTNFANQRGLIFDGSSFTVGSVFFDNPTYVLGHPIAEPYWVRAVVGGVEQDVLVQLFERRVLTYTPANTDPFKVEMGNVGQHYYQWRYLTNTTPNPATGGGPTKDDPTLRTLQVAPVKDWAGQPFQLSGTKFGPNETLKLWETSPWGEVNALPSITSDAQGNFSYTYKSHGPLAGQWVVTAHGLSSGVEKTGYFTLEDFIPGGQPAGLELSRYHGTINDKIDLHGYNFYFNERFSYWLTAPDGKVYAGEQTPSHRNASHAGEIHLLGLVLPKAQPGQWAITVYGMFSRRIAVTYFIYDGPPSP